MSNDNDLEERIRRVLTVDAQRAPQGAAPEFAVREARQRTPERHRRRTLVAVAGTAVAVVAVLAAAALLPASTSGRTEPAPSTQQVGSPGPTTASPPAEGEGESPDLAAKDAECRRMKAAGDPIICDPQPPQPGRSSISRDPAIEVRMTRAIQQRFAALAPAVRWDSTIPPENPTFRPLVFGFTDYNKESPGRDFKPASYDATTETIASNGRGTFFIVVGSWADEVRVTGGAAIFVTTPEGKVLCDARAKPKTCTRGPNRELIRIEAAESGGSGVKQNAVGVVKADGTFVYLVSNSTIDKGDTTTSGPALSVAQLTEIALDPAFSIRR